MEIQIQNFLNFFVTYAQKELNPKTIFLFGSRARGDARPDSDIDIAIEFDEFSQKHAWERFWLDMDYYAPILLKLDLIDFNTAQMELKHKG